MRRFLLIVLAAAAISACGDDSAPVYVIGGDTGGGDTGSNDTGSSDTGTDAADPDATDAGADTPGDTGSDAETDAAGDAGDTGSDTTVEDTSGDTGGDAGADTGEDTTSEEICTGGVDEDGDDFVDCDDPDCEGDVACVPPSCGNGRLDDGEACEDGNLDDGDGCDGECALESGFRNACGDGIIVAVAGELCDDGLGNSDTEPDACRRDCLPASCGDRVADTGEECDSGGVDEGTCTADCTLIESCGDGEVDDGEECDDGNARADDGCHLCELTGASECGDGVYAPGFEDCDAGAGCGGASVCNEFCECEVPELCGNGRVDADEDCDGSDSPCGADGFCNDICLCEDYECGNDLVEGTEECDGTDDDACGTGEACNDSCECFSTGGAPVLSPMPSDPLAGPTPGVVVTGWDQTGGCEDAPGRPHRLAIRLRGTSSASIDELTLRISSIDSVARRIPVSGGSGAFNFVADVCLETIPEGLSMRMTVLDSRGRESNAVNWTLPTLRPATVTAMQVYAARDPNLHVFRFTGSAPDRNIAALRTDIFAGGEVLAEDFDIGVADVVFTGTNYVALAGLTGVADTGIDSYEGLVLTYGLEASAQRTASVRSLAGSGDQCVPATSFGPTCSGSMVCGASGTFSGTCRSASGSAPVLSSATEGEVVMGDPICSAEFPNQLRWRMVGSSSEPVIAVMISSTAFGDEEFEIATEAYGPGSIDEVVGICMSGTASDLRVRMVDEAGRQSAQRTVTFLP